MEVVLDGDSLVGDPSGREEKGVVGVDPESPKIRHSSRKMSVRSLSSRGHLSKLKPKLPLIRMAEMRKGGLRGRELLHSGVKGLGGPKLKADKGSGGRSLKVLMSIPENSMIGVGQLEGMGAEGSTDGSNDFGDGGSCGVEDLIAGERGDPLDLGNVASEGMESEGVISQQVWEKETLPARFLNDCALDLVAAQPLQEMSFVAE